MPVYEQRPDGTLVPAKELPTAWWVRLELWWRRGTPMNDPTPPEVRR